LTSYELRDHRRLLERAIEGISPGAPVQAALRAKLDAVLAEQNDRAGWPPVREHDVTALTLAELERARRELAASLALPGPAHRSASRSRHSSPRSTPNGPGGPPPGLTSRQDSWSPDFA
jgi:hypothetical protein